MNNIGSAFKGIDLASDSFAINIACLLGAVRVLQMSDDDELKMMGSNVIDIAHDYANAAACTESGDVK
ncbi:hypothetical protein F3I27_23685 [Pantoea sp. Bo_2]|uniref:hypothetical protein n=1 Tax=unclassified Pantoea TaxID=2630326 RepID=UPI001231EC63|nr:MULTISPECIES: hypothetical protein [unclassified Pantoea]KAA5949423.1 hypothetical protein F3I55_22850 [Pantoea sp. VH_24]KAA5955290.1 hypothetical protein F3I53_20180 [Pantoea sp. VH_16]KAA5961351.1 hypothetical protein F3I54_19755 [Pantoea sp. VH_18]KAA5991504.1 hypothetical protein F3I46_22780 [Pantoea sp. M_1]KAA5997547.1 hypothetical protein F3I45_20765 [Pantoea sp. F_7]